MCGFAGTFSGDLLSTIETSNLLLTTNPSDLLLHSPPYRFSILPTPYSFPNPHLPSIPRTYLSTHQPLPTSSVPRTLHKHPNPSAIQLGYRDEEIMPDLNVFDVCFVQCEFVLAEEHAEGEVELCVGQTNHNN